MVKSRDNIGVDKGIYTASYSVAGSFVYVYEDRNCVGITSYETTVVYITIIRVLQLPWQVNKFNMITN